MWSVLNSRAHSTKFLDWKAFIIPAIFKFPIVIKSATDTAAPELIKHFEDFVLHSLSRQLLIMLYFEGGK